MVRGMFQLFFGGALILSFQPLGILLIPCYLWTNIYESENNYYLLLYLCWNKATNQPRYSIQDGSWPKHKIQWNLVATDFLVYLIGGSAIDLVWAYLNRVKIQHQKRLHLLAFRFYITWLDFYFVSQFRMHYSDRLWVLIKFCIFLELYRNILLHFNALCTIFFYFINHNSGDLETFLFQGLLQDVAFRNYSFEL